ncbi:MAG: flagellar transcriptional regulator FlhD [Rhodocyclaceae bacterium]|nr:flagellar transcriptional regulator FlhD [Rhodocyclaceae bacterium]
MPKAEEREMTAAGCLQRNQGTESVYLMLAQQLIRADRETAQYRLGIGADIAEVIDNPDA